MKKNTKVMRTRRTPKAIRTDSPTASKSQPVRKAESKRRMTRREQARVRDVLRANGLTPCTGSEDTERVVIRVYPPAPLRRTLRRLWHRSE